MHSANCLLHRLNNQTAWGQKQWCYIGYDTKTKLLILWKEHKILCKTKLDFLASFKTRTSKDFSVTLMSHWDCHVMLQMVYVHQLCWPIHCNSESVKRKTLHEDKSKGKMGNAKRKIITKQVFKLLKQLKKYLASGDSHYQDAMRSAQDTRRGFTFYCMTTNITTLYKYLTSSSTKTERDQNVIIRIKDSHDARMNLRVVPPHPGPRLQNTQVMNLDHFLFIIEQLSNYCMEMKMKRKTKIN